MPVGAPITEPPEVNLFGDKRDPEAEAAEAERILDAPDAVPSDESQPDTEEDPEVDENAVDTSELDAAMAEADEQYVSEEEEQRQNLQQSLRYAVEHLGRVEKTARKNDKISLANDFVSGQRILNHLAKRLDSENPFTLKGKKA